MSAALPITATISLAVPDSDGHHQPMADDRRNRVAGATCFFTVNLAGRRGDLLVRHIDALRDAVRMVRVDAPFPIDAWGGVTGR